MDTARTRTGTAVARVTAARRPATSATRVQYGGVAEVVDVDREHAGMGP